jgi:hypothetical protein
VFAMLVLIYVRLWIRLVRYFLVDSLIILLNNQCFVVVVVDCDLK